MEYSSSQEITVDAPKSALIALVTDPWFVSGMIGHITMLEAYDPQKNKFVTFDEMTGIPTRFKVAYIFGTPEGKMTMHLGEMAGPVTYADIVTYRGFTYDNKMKWELSFGLKEVSPERTKVEVVTKTEEEKGFFGRLLERSHLNLAEHMIKAHIIPFIQVYIDRLSQFKSIANLGSVEYRKLAEEQGTVNEVIAKLMALAKESNVEHAMIVLEGEDFKGKVVLKGGKPVDSWFRFADGSIKTGNDAILEALASTAKGKGLLYTVDVEALVNRVFDQIFSTLVVEEVKRGQV